MNKGSFLLTILLLTGMLTAVTHGKTVMHIVDIKGKNWTLVSYGKPDSLKTPLANAVITFNINDAGDGLGGSAGCNHYGARIKISGNQLSIKDLSMTEMYCGQKISAQESAYASLLIKVKTYLVKGDKLHLSCSDGQVLIFKMSQKK